MPISRQELLRGAGLGALAYVLGAGRKDASPQPTPQEAPKIPQPENRIYKSGDTIETPAGPVKIKGWWFLIDPAESKKYEDSGPHYATFVLENVPAQSPMWLPNIDTGGGGSFMLPVNVDGKNMLGMRGYPPNGIPGDPTLQSITLKVVEKNTETNSYAVHLYPVMLDYSTYIPDGGDSNSPPFYAELPLPEQAGKDICAVQQLFSNLGIQLPIYIFAETDPSGRGGDFSPANHYAEVPSIIFTEPVFANEGQMKLYHELSHALLNNLIYNRLFASDGNKWNPRLENLMNAFEGLRIAVGKPEDGQLSGIAGAPTDIKKNPYFAMFGESNYVQTTDKDELTHYSHPFDNYDELFASSMTVLHFFGRKFIDNYKEYQANHTIEHIDLIANVANAIIDLVEYFARGAEDPETLIKQVLPEYDELKAVLAPKPN